MELASGRRAARGKFDARDSVADAVRDAQLVVVAVPVGSAVSTVREVLAEAPADATVTDVASTKRALADAIDDPRFVPGHPVAGGDSSGPDRAAAELFDGATWFLTPRAGTEPARVEIVERFVSALGARAVRRDAADHDRLLALTSHLPHALANALMRLAAAEAGALESAGASFREMTRVAGANGAVWTDIFLENGDLIARAVGELRDELSSAERALANGDRGYLERSIEEAQQGRNALLTHAYQTEAAQLHRIRIRVPDRPGVLARITQILGAASVNIEDFELRHVSPEYGGVLVILVAGAETAELARTLLRTRATRPLRAGTGMTLVDPSAAGRLAVIAVPARPDPQHDLAELLARLQPLVGGRGVGEREHAVDDRPCLPGRDQVVGAPEVVGRAHRRAEDRELLPPDAVQGGRRVRPGRRAAHDDAALRAGRIEGAAPRRLADVVDDDVRAAAGQILDGRNDLLRRVVHARVGAELASPAASFSSLDEVTTTFAPSALAIASAAVATPPPTPHTSTHSSGCSRARVTSMRYAVSKTSGNAAASSNPRPSGIGCRKSRGTAISSA